MQIRRATKEDLNEIQRLYRQGDEYHADLIPVYFKTPEKDRPTELILDWINGADSDYIVCGTKKLSGFLNIKVMATPPYSIFKRLEYAFIETLVVEKELRLCGYGSALLEGAKAWARTRNLKHMQLSVWAANTAALQFYSKHGFTPIRYSMHIEL